jgi:hypothetical protein
MKRCYHFLFIAAIVIAMAACQKEVHEDATTTPTTGGPAPADTIPNTPGTNTEVGSWKFMSLQGTGTQTAAFTQASQSVKATASSNFTSQNNGGSITFDSNTMTASSVTMAINTTAKTLVYLNGTLYDSLQTPINQTLPPQNATSAYQKIGTDSLHFQDGGFLNVLTGGMLPSAPTGCKLAFSGNTMKMTIVYDTVTTQDYQGIPATVTIHMVLVATLQKQ